MSIQVTVICDKCKAEFKALEEELYFYKWGGRGGFKHLCRGCVMEWKNLMGKMHSLNEEVNKFGHRVVLED